MVTRVYLWSVICLGAVLLIDLASCDCELKCKNHDDCLDWEACIDSVCLDPCDIEKCGLNTICVTEKHVAKCRCPKGLNGNPKVRCTNKCSSKADCYEQEDCVNGTCLYPCYNKACGKCAFCQSVNQQANCSCPEGYRGDPLVECYKFCTNDLECMDSEACIEGRCGDPCNNKKCGMNTICITEGHVAKCKCQDGLVGDPEFRCNTMCNDNSDCFYAEQCIDGACLFSCFKSVCGVSAVCEIYNQTVVCKCPPDHVGDPYKRCYQNCQNDDECFDSLACIDSKCSDPCDTEKCGLNAICVTEKHVGKCQCPKGLVGNPKIRCTNHCSTKADCYEQENCVDGTCLYPCYKDPCGKRAFCQSVNQQADCSCPEGYRGDPLVECYKICNNDQECMDSEACIQGMCGDPCNNKKCGMNTICITEGHVAKCKCQDGLVGDPEFRCNTKCNSDSDCFYAEQCIDGVCLFSCFSNVCGVSAVCEIYNQTVICKCPPDYVGDPYKHCYLKCQVNSTCRDDQACLEERCQDPCKAPNNPCGDCGGCEVQGHVAQCVCSRRYTGNTTDQCSSGKSCFWSFDCDKSEACIDRICQDPCKNKKCGDKAECGVKLHIAKCYCREGYNGIVEPFCRKGLL